MNETSGEVRLMQILDHEINQSVPVILKVCFLSWFIVTIVCTVCVVAVGETFGYCTGSQGIGFLFDGQISGVGWLLVCWLACLTPQQHASVYITTLACIFFFLKTA